MKNFDAVKKNGLVVEFTLQKPFELVKWVTKVIGASGKKISQDAASWMVDNSNEHMTDILNEIQKVIVYTGDSHQVTIDDVQAVCTKSIKSIIFDLTDAVAGRNAGQAFKVLNDMLAMKEPIPKIIFMITRQIRQLLQVKIFMGQGLNMSQAGTKAGLTPYAASKVCKQAERIQQTELTAAFKECLEIDSAIKSGRMNERVAVELLIANLCGNPSE